jgi:hypothetical protein
MPEGKNCPWKRKGREGVLTFEEKQCGGKILSST